MKTTLIGIQNEADHADAKKRIEKLLGSQRICWFRGAERATK